ncbi:MAG: Kdo hydroxylase family protein [Verrucomicrobiota bacterium]|nr:Kdo hydroxylase family protein [Verrucomicrobiota bacterium]
MAEKIVVQQDEWKKEANRFKYATELEAGNILFFPETPFDFPPEEKIFLLQQRQASSKGRKNIAYKPQLDKITNHDSKDPETAQKMLDVLRNYSQRATHFLSEILSPYARGWKHDYASFRPFQEQGRKLRLRARNDLLHVDAFPTRPLHGARILRFFTNINPTEGRRWITSRPFGELAASFGGERGVPFPSSVGYSLKERLERKMKEFVAKTGVKIPLRSPYDVFMLKMHHFLKENEDFQKNCPKDHWEFPPNSCWAVFTDLVSHAALSGQYALEQTFIVPQNVLLFPEKSPVSILERLSGKNMVNIEFLSKMLASRG